MESYSLIVPRDMKCKPFKGLAPADKILLQLPGWYSDFTRTCDAPIEMDHWSAISADTWSAIRVDPTFVNWVQRHFAKSYMPSLSASPNLPPPRCSTCTTRSSTRKVLCTPTVRRLASGEEPVAKPHPTVLPPSMNRINPDLKADGDKDGTP